ncbi:MAG TPA: VWA domain-containing protein [Terriglobales bacterium]|jgi:VWFA-related protein|nr:VWA domain-containing protein [Terriglobales bacterium]
MYSRILIFFAVLITLTPLANAAQNSMDQDLPSAPSAVSQQQQAARKAARQAVAQTPAQKPADTSPPSGNQPEATTAKPETAPVGSSETPPQAEQPSATFHKRVNEVNVVFTVTDKHGRYVNNLTKTDFNVLDDQRPALEVSSFRRETDLPLRVGLLVDASNSVRDRFKFEQQAAIEFLNETIRPRYDKAFVVGFDVTPEVTQDFTDNTDALSNGVRSLRPGGGTAMYDALYFACRDKLMKESQTGPVRRAIILLSDGDDNQSHVTREEAVEMAERAEVIVYAISTNINGSSSRGDKVLERIADATGGRAFFPFQITEVSNAFSEIQNELRSQYALAYTPASLAPNGQFHSIEIIAQNRKGLRVRSRHGYYAPTN